MDKVTSREAIAEIYNQGLDAVVGLVEQLLEQMSTLYAQVEVLERQRALDSHNSSKPPSTDRRGNKPSPKSLRQRSGRKSGGQPGHPGKTLLMTNTPDRIVAHSVERCDECGESLAEAPTVAVERRQVIDLLPNLFEFVEHRVEIRQCQCGRMCRGSFPVGVEANVQYGPDLKALAVYLNQQQLIPTERTTEILVDVFGCESFSEGTLRNAVEECYEGLGTIETVIKAGVREATVAHFDETGLNIGGKLHWLHVASTASLTHYGWHQKRGSEGADHIGILPGFQGTGVHDGLASYRRYYWKHALCNAHHLRELTFIEEQLGQAWAGEMGVLLREIKQAVDKARTAGETRLMRDIEEAFEARYGNILAAGFAVNPPPERPSGKRGRPKRGKALSLLDRLRDQRSAVLAFM